MSAIGWAKPVDMPRILAAEFVHRGRNFPAYAFDQGDGMDHFDETGASLRKAFLGRIQPHFQPVRQEALHPVLKKVRPTSVRPRAPWHPIVSVGDGVVVKASYTKGNGKYIKVRHNSTYTTQYLHMSRRKVKEGQAVRQGDVIRYVGNTGWPPGPTYASASGRMASRWTTFGRNSPSTPSGTGSSPLSPAPSPIGWKRWPGSIPVPGTAAAQSLDPGTMSLHPTARAASSKATPSPSVNTPPPAERSGWYWTPP